jgi:hypothetical protein
MSKPTEADIQAEVEKLRTLGKDDLRSRWSALFGKTPPPALTKELLGRMIAWRIQEKFYGGHDKATLRLLDGLARGKVAKPATEPQLRPGTVLMREHGGKRHTVTRHPRRLRLARSDLFQPFRHRPHHHRDVVERTPLLWPADETECG